MRICIKCGKSAGEVHPVGKMNDPYYVGICCACGGDVYKPMTTAVCYFSEWHLLDCSNRFIKRLEEAMEYWIEHYGQYQKVYFGRLPNRTIHYISTATLPEVIDFFTA